jgi:hypothetical protein
LDTMSNEAGTSDSSSPSFSGSRGAEHLDDPSHRLQHFPSSGAHQDIQAVGTLGRSLTNPPSRGISSGLVPAHQPTDTSAGPLSARTYETFPTYEQNVAWTSPFLQQSPRSLITDKSQAEELPYWRHDLSMPTSYPQHPYPVTHPSAPLAQSAQSSMEQTPNFGHRDLHGWSASTHPPLRSMSLVSPEELPIHYQNQYYHNAPNEFHPNTNTSDIQPPMLSNINSTMSGSDPPLPLPSMGYLHESTTQNMNYVYPSSWSSVSPNHAPQMSGSESERFTHGWYSDPSALAQVKEEEAGSQFHHSTHPDNMAYQANPG